MELTAILTPAVEGGYVAYNPDMYAKSSWFRSQAPHRRDIFLSVFVKSYHPFFFKELRQRESGVKRGA